VSEQDLHETKIDGELTRRQWLLILGRLAAIAGFSGIAPEFVAALPAEAPPLPPGLYYPSQDHLSHALGEVDSLHSIPTGSETEYVQPSSGPFRPRFFSDKELKIVSRMTEIMLGKADSGALAQSVQWLDLYLDSAAGIRQAALNLDPLHRTLAAAYYGEAAVQELETSDPQTVVRSGIAALQQLSMEKYAQEFLRVNDSQQNELLSALSAADPKTPPGKFYELVRTEIARGYYTSAEGLKELDYKGNWYYASCPGCEKET